MIEAYAVKVAASLEDGVTPSLLRMIDTLMRANELMVDFSANARKVSAMGLNIGRNFDKAAAGATAFADSVGRLAGTEAILGSMAASSGVIAKNMAMADAASAKVQGGGGYANRMQKRASGFLAGSLLFGVYENANLQDINVTAAMTAQKTGADIDPYISMLRHKELGYAGKFGFATGGRVKPFAEAYLEGARLLRTLPQADQMRMMDMAMPYAAVEAKMKNIPLPEAMQAFIGLAHQAGAYTPDKAYPLFESMLQASLTTHASLGQISRAASYALPALNAAGANASDVMMLIATMQQAGIMNTKSGTWLNNLALNSLPNTLGSGLFKNKNQNEALHKLGLYVGDKSQFYQNGRMDLMKMVSILAEDRLKIKPEEFNALSRLAFGIQGQRAASLFSEDYVQKNLGTLADLRNSAPTPIDVGRLIKQLSTVAKADQTIANANMTIMNASAALTPSANWALDKASATFGFMERNGIAGPVGYALKAERGVVGKSLMFMWHHDVISPFGLVGKALSTEYHKIFGSHQSSKEPPKIEVTINLDGKQISKHLVGPKNMVGPNGLNPSASRPMPGTPGMGY